MQGFILFALVFFLVLAAYWSMVVFPKQREFRKKQKYLLTLQPGDEVVTYGGLIGTILEIDDEKGLAYLQIAEGTVVRIITPALMQAYEPGQTPEGVGHEMQAVVMADADPAIAQEQQSQ